MSHICMHCGHHFDEPHNRYNRRWSDSDDSEQYCPNCGSEDIEEAEHCLVCDDWYKEDSVVNGICRECLIKSATPDTALTYGAQRKESIEINGFLKHVFDGHIEDILTALLKTQFDLKDQAQKYCLDDLWDYSEWKAERIDE